MRILRSPIADGRFIGTKAVFGGVTGAVRHSFLGEAFGCPRRGGSVVWARAISPIWASYAAPRGYVQWRIRHARSAMCSGAYAERFLVRIFLCTRS